MAVDSNLVMGAVSFFLLSLYAGLAVVSHCYWQYLRKKNASRAPAEARWTLALVDAELGEKHCLDLDTQKFSHRESFCITLSIRSKLEKRASHGRYLTSQEARKIIKAAEAPLRVAHYADEFGSVTLAPLTIITATGEEETLDIEDLQPQVDLVVRRIRDKVVVAGGGMSAAAARISALKLRVLDLAPGESASFDEEMWALRVIKAFCCNTATRSNVRKDFTSPAYTKGVTINQELWVRWYVFFTFFVTEIAFLNCKVSIDRFFL